ncbi:hypothetical protein CDIK_3289 [Cucumispora dikerogammari]|nr:hypothetical protein CDIK_3289 [Cucumispora dikerogammari]
MKKKQQVYSNLFSVSIDCDNPVAKIGGSGTFVQIDETDICKGRIILNPSSAYDDIKGAQWLVGGVTEGVKKEFFICLVSNKQIATLAAVFAKYLLPGTNIMTDGHSSCPTAVQIFKSFHIVVNHSETFVIDEGFNTNSVENLWRQFEKGYKKRNGLWGTMMVDFLTEFSWKYKTISPRSRETVRSAYLYLVNLL